MIPSVIKNDVRKWRTGNQKRGKNGLSSKR